MSFISDWIDAANKGVNDAFKWDPNIQKSYQDYVFYFTNYRDNTSGDHKSTTMMTIDQYYDRHPTAPGAKEYFAQKAAVYSAQAGTQGGNAGPLYNGMVMGTAGMFAPVERAITVMQAATPVAGPGITVTPKPDGSGTEISVIPITLPPEPTAGGGIQIVDVGGVPSIVNNGVISIIGKNGISAVGKDPCTILIIQGAFTLSFQTATFDPVYTHLYSHESLTMAKITGFMTPTLGQVTSWIEVAIPWTPTSALGYFKNMGGTEFFADGVITPSGGGPSTIRFNSVTVTTGGTNRFYVDIYLKGAH